MPDAAHATARRFAELTNDYEAVAVLPLASGHTVLTARTSDGIAHIEILDGQGARVDDDRVLDVLGAARATVTAAAGQLAATAAAYFKLHPETAGGNKAGAARQAGVARETFRKYLRDVDVAELAPAA